VGTLRAPGERTGRNSTKGREKSFPNPVSTSQVDSSRTRPDQAEIIEFMMQPHFLKKNEEPQDILGKITVGKENMKRGKRRKKKEIGTVEDTEEDESEDEDEERIMLVQHRITVVDFI